MFATNSCFLLTADDDSISLKYLTAILNSKLILFYFNMVGSSSGMGTLEWTEVATKKIPIPVISKSKQQPFINIIDDIVYLRKKNVDSDITHLESKLNLMVNDIYGLTKDEKEIVERFSK